MCAKETSEHYYEYIISQIKGMIAQGELKQGEKIPSERELAERFNVSRVPVREALKILEYMGILDSTQGDGTYVRNYTVGDMISKMDFVVTATAATIMDMQELRINLECFAAYHAALRRTDEDIAMIRQVLVDMRKAKKKTVMDDETIMDLRRLSHQFHRCLIQAAHNTVLTSVYENLYELLDISRQFTIDTSGISYNSILAHEAIFNHVIAQNAEGAREAMEEHLDDVRVKLDAILTGAEAEEQFLIRPVG